MILAELIEQVKKLEAGECPDKGIYRRYYLDGVGHTIYQAGGYVMIEQSLSFTATEEDSEHTLKEHWKELFGEELESEYEVASITLHHRKQLPTLYVISLVKELVEPKASEMYRRAQFGWNKAILHAALAHPQLKAIDAQLIHEYLCVDDPKDMSMPWDVLDRLEMNIEMANELLK